MAAVIQEMVTVNSHGRHDGQIRAFSTGLVRLVLADRGTRKPSVHTLKAHRQDFDGIATLVVGADTGDVSRMSLGDITTESMRTAFAEYAKTHEAATIYSKAPSRSNSRKMGNFALICHTQEQILIHATAD